MSFRYSTMSGAGATSSSTADGTTTAASGDVAFAQMMIPHHEQAVELADIALENDTASQDEALATQIKAAQDPEIQAMQGAPDAQALDASGEGEQLEILVANDRTILASTGGQPFRPMR